MQEDHRLFYEKLCASNFKAGANAEWEIRTSQGIEARRNTGMIRRCAQSRFFQSARSHPNRCLNTHLNQSLLDLGRDILGALPGQRATVRNQLSLVGHNVRR